MSVIDVNNRASNRLNGFLGDLIGGIFQPQSNGQAEQLANDLYLANQELKAAKTAQTIATITAGVFGITAAYFGYKQFKK